MRYRTAVFSCGLLLCCLLMAACGTTTSTVVSPTTGTPVSSATPSSTGATPTPGSNPSPGSTPPPSSSSPTPAPAVYGDLTGIWRGDDNGYYYVRQVGNAVTWAGFSADDGASYTNVLCATRNGNSFSGKWADMPRGNVAGSGTLSLQIDASNPNDIQIHKTVGNAFGATTWHKMSAAPSFPTMVPIQNYKTQPSSPLSGNWQSLKPLDGSLYYVRQVDNNVWWLGVSDGNGKSYTNVFCGSRTNDVISGNWSDVPRGATRGSGMLSVLYVEPTPVEYAHLHIITVTGGFASSDWGETSLP